MAMTNAERQARYRERAKKRQADGLREMVNAERRRCLEEWRAEFVADGLDASGVASLNALLAKPDRDPDEFAAWFGRVMQSELELELREQQRGKPRSA